jgi:hypothetical protein
MRKGGCGRGEAAPLAVRPAALSSTREVRDLWVQVIPGLRARSPHFRLSAEPAWVVEAAGSYGDKVATPRGRGEQRHPAVGAERSAGRMAAGSCCRVDPRLSSNQQESRGRNDHGGRKPSTTGALAITAVTVHHRQRCCGALVAYRTARAAAEERYFHVSPPVPKLFSVG